MFDPEDFARLAERLVQAPCGSADSRTAISRAYYATFLVAKKFLDPHFHLEKTAVIHDHICKLFVNCLNDDAKELGRKLDELRAKRNDADYHIGNDEVDSYHTARLWNGIARRTIKKLQIMLDSPATSGPLIAEMKDYAKKSGLIRCR